MTKKITLHTSGGSTALPQSAVRRMYSRLSGTIVAITTALAAITYPAIAQNDAKGKEAGTAGTVVFPDATRWTENDPASVLSKYADLSNPQVKLVQEKATKTNTGTIVYKFDEYYQGLKVQGGNYAIMVKDGYARFMNGNFYPVQSDISAVPALSESAALSVATKQVGAQRYIWQDEGNSLQKLGGGDNGYPQATLLWIEDHRADVRDHQLHLAYAFNIYATEPISRQMVYVDAHTGKVLFVNNLLHNTAASGPSLYSGTVSFQAALSGSVYTMSDVTRGGGINTYSLNNTTGPTGYAVTSSTTTFAANAAIDAHWGAEKVYDYWQNVQGRNSFDNAGSTINSFVHYALNYNNAFWDGYEMIYGDGSGIASGGFSSLVSLDVCAHEIGHGVCQHTAALDYELESGAMNEGFSDIWGAIIENYANPHETDAVAKNMWKIGEEISASPLRSMDNPKLQYQPDTYGGTYWYTLTGCTPGSTNDQCGVHQNSGVLNHWFYLLTQGGSGTNDKSNTFSVTGVGATKSANIAYQTELLLTNSSNFANCRTTSIAAATTLYGACSPEVIAVTKAWYAVGVGTDYTGGAASISGAASVCTGSSITLSSTATGGSWTSGNPGVATINAATGVLAAVAAGTTVVSYSTGSCTASKIITVYATPAAINGAATVCAGITTTLTDATTGGTWSSSATAKATVGASTGVVTGVATGSATISYTTAGGCYATMLVSVTPAINPGIITGPSTMSTGDVATLTESLSGGTWSSSNPSVLDVDASGIATALSNGTATISYAITGSCGTAYATKGIAVGTALPGISGNSPVCAGNTLSLSDAASGGTWTTSSSAIATVSATGLVTGIAAGTATISYTVAGISVTAVVTVNPLPAAIVGASSLCAGSTAAFTDATSGGIWGTSNMSVANVGATGIVSAISSGTANIMYILPTGCFRSTVVTVSDAPASISGPAGICAGNTVTFTGAGTGTWSSGAPSVVNINSATGVAVAASVGTAVITYTTGGSCSATLAVSVIGQPAVITGASSPICNGTTASLSDVTAGGSWSSSNSGIASVDNVTGIVTGTGAGTATIYYTIGSGCSRSAVMTINPSPAPIAGTLSTCPGNTTALSDPTTPGSSWLSSNTSVATINIGTGLATGVAAGMATITYTLGTGCYTTAVLTVNAAPAAIGGTLTVCQGSATTLTNTVTGGSWASGNTAKATVDAATGVVTGIATGTAVISYGTGAGCVKTATVTVNAAPSAIGGLLTVCPGGTTSLTNTTTGGTWVSTTTSVATIAATSGIATGVGMGTSTISYRTSAGCIATDIVTVTTSPAASTGTAILCASGGTTTLTNAVTGGTWASSNNAVALVASAGAGVAIVTGGASAGTATITYSLGGGCKATNVVTVSALPSLITGSLTACTGVITTLNNSYTGGTWSSSNTAAGTIQAGATASIGLFRGLAPGTTTVSYAYTATGCARSVIVTVNASPDAGTISGGSAIHIAVTPTVALASDGDAGGTWSSSNTAKATVDASGVVTGIAAGTANITYAITAAGCTSRAIQMMTMTASRAAGSNMAHRTDIQLYPNPNQGSFTIKGQWGDATETVAAEIVDMAGQVIWKGTTPAGNGAIDQQIVLPANIANGSYMLRLHANDRELVIRFAVGK